MFLKRWFWTNTLISGFLALCWLVLRSGPKPSRFAYPCQQAALSAATLAFGAPVVGALVAARHGITAFLRRPIGVAVAALGLLVTAGMWAYASWSDPYTGPRLDPPPDYRAQVFHVTDCPQDPTGDRFLGLDNLLALMGREGLAFYKSEAAALWADSNGIIASDDVVVIKINYQWNERGGTNTDLLAGLIRRIVAHPDTFTGEIVVGENTQVIPTNWFNRFHNNAQDHRQSPRDVINAFRQQGHTVSLYSWRDLRTYPVDEYSTGDMTNGYVVGEYDSQLQGRVSYPKFRTDAGTHISVRYGVWDPDTGTYDRERLKFINVPVLKSHHGWYGVTACVKNYMGVVADGLGTNSHNAIQYGILGALMGDIQLADLNILDCIWINADPYDGPATSYARATRRDELVASVDPVAADIWAVTNILIPAFLENQYSPPWPSPSADPDNPNSEFREYLDNSMSHILAAGYAVTNDLTQIDATTGNGGAGDFDNDSDVDIADYDQFEACFTWSQPSTLNVECEAGDFDGDSDIDCSDWRSFTLLWTGPGDPPALAQCMDCNDNQILDGCDTTCAMPGCALPCGESADCNANYTPDNCELTYNDCNGSGVPDDCEGFEDRDGDGSLAVCDCDDDDPENYPGNSEACDDRDNNCNGLADEGLSTDQDGDGHFTPGSCWEPADDCDDDDETVFPGAFEVLCNGVDENCNGPTDDDRNRDNDPVSFCDGDCDDYDPNNYPGNREVCDGQDNDCDRRVDAWREGRLIVGCVR